MGDGAGDEAGAETQFVRGEAAGFASHCFSDAGDFEEHVPWKDDGDPELWGAFTFTHSSFRRTGGDGLVREDADEDFTFTLEEAGDGDSAGFDLVVLQPAAIKHLEAEVTEVQLVRAGGVSRAVAALGFAIFYSTGKKGHGDG